MGDYQTPVATAAASSADATATKQGLESTNPEGAILYRQLRQKPLNIVGGRGSYILTDDGREILDATCGAAVSCLGHSDDRVHGAILEQLQKIPYCYSLYFTNNAAENLARFLVDSTGGKMSRASIFCSGRLLIFSFCLLQE